MKSLAIVVGALLPVLLIAAGPIEIKRLAQVTAIYVAPLGDDQESARVRLQLIGKLVSAKFNVVTTADKSVAIVKGAATVEPTAPSTIIRAESEVSLGLTLESRSGTILWGFDPGKCSSQITGRRDELSCAVGQLAKAFNADIKAATSKAAPPPAPAH